MTLGKRIQELRKGAGLSQEGLGEALGVSRQAVSKWESDGGIPELDTLIAMSRLFQVTLGQLLGVEPPAEADPPGQTGADRTGAGVDEAVIEEVLRRYAREQERQRALSAMAANNDPRRRKYRNYAAAGAGVLAGLLLLFGFRLYDRMERMRSDINNLESRLINLNNSIGSQIYAITGQMEDILADQNNLVSGAEWTVTAFDHRAETVSVRHRISLKSYSPGTQIQLLLRWKTVEGETGETATGWADGPDFTLEGELPMNHQLERTVRIRDGGGNILEQELEPVYDGMHPDNFEVYSKGLSTPFVIHVGNSVTAMAEGGPAVILMSSHPELLWPVSARLTATLNGQMVVSTPLSIAGESRGVWRGETEPVELHLKEGDEVVFEAIVTDNLGRSIRLLEGYRSRDDHIREEPMAEEAYAPVNIY